jgi:hypothetical protein
MNSVLAVTQKRVVTSPDARQGTSGEGWITMARAAALDQAAIDRLADFESESELPAAAADAIDAASLRIASVYAELLGHGLNEEDVCRAMMGATVTLYDAVGLRESLPVVLRRIAARIESTSRAH